MAKDLRSKTVNQIMYITIGCVIAVTILCVVLFMFFGGNKNSENMNVQVGENQNQVELSSEEASTSIGNSVEQVSEYQEVEDSETVQVQTENEEISQVAENSNESIVENNENTEEQANTAETNIIENSENVEVATEETPKDPNFTMPVQGEIVKQYGKEKLIYSDTLKEWTTHLGIDIKADKTTIVKASAEGCVKSIKNDPRYGLTVVIEHENGFTSVYSNLLTAEFVVVGENVKSGQTIGTVGNSATFEILDDPHLYFEILKDGNSVDPEMYIK